MYYVTPCTPWFHVNVNIYCFRHLNKWRYVLVFYFSLAKNIAELLLLQYEVVVLHLSCLEPLYVMDTYQEYEDQHKYSFTVECENLMVVFLGLWSLWLYSIFALNKSAPSELH